MNSISVSYDSKYDILYVRDKHAGNSYGEESNDGIVIYKDIATDSVTGIAIKGIQQKYMSGKTMWYLCQEHFKSLDDARKRAIEVGRENYDSIHKVKRNMWALLFWRKIENNDAKTKEIKDCTVEELVRWCKRRECDNCCFLDEENHFHCAINSLNNYILTNNMEKLKLDVGD